MATTAFASDFDGTLCESNWTTGEERFDPADLAAVRAYQEAGGLFGVCTGRSLGGVLVSVEGLLNLDFYIVLSGAQVLDRNRTVIFEKSLPRALVEELYERYTPQNGTFIAPQGDTYVAVGRTQMPAFGVVSSLADALADFGARQRHGRQHGQRR